MALYVGCSVIEMENVAQGRKPMRKDIHHHERDIWSCPGLLLLENNSITFNAKMTEIKIETKGEPNLTRGKAKENGYYRNRDEIKSV